MAKMSRWQLLFVVTASTLVCHLTDRAAAQTDDAVNVLLFIDEQNPAAKQASEVGIEFAGENLSPKVKIGTQKTVMFDHHDVHDPTEVVCSGLEEMLDEGTSPHLMIYMPSQHSGHVSKDFIGLSENIGIPGLVTTTGYMGNNGEMMDGMDMEASQQVVKVYTPGDTYPEILRTFIQNMNLTNAGILYDHTFDLSGKLRSLLLNLPVRHVMKPLGENNDEIKEQLMRLESVSIYNYFILGSLETQKSVFSLASTMKMYGEKYSWFAGTMESGMSFDPSCCSKMKVTFFQPDPDSSSSIKSLQKSYGLDEKPAIEAGFYFDAVVNSIHAVDQLRRSGALAGVQARKCNDSTPPAQLVDFRSQLKNTKRDYAFGPLKIMDNEAYMDFSVKVESYKIDGEKVTERKSFGMWNSMKPSMMDLNPETAEMFSNLGATTLYRVVSVLQAPFVMEDGKGGYTGFCIDLINELKSMMNFEYEISIVEEYGTMNEDMEWNGMIRELIDKNADIGLGALSVMAERENVVDFTVPYYDLVGISILMKKPEVPTQLFKFLSVLEDSVWMCILAAYFVTSVIMWIFDKWSPYSYQNNMEKYVDDDEKRLFDLKECLWFCMTSLTPQGGGEAPKNLSGRLVAATWWLFGFIIIASYTANLAAFLTVSRLETPVESLEDLAKQYKIKYAPKNGSASATYFKRMAYIEERFYEIWKDMSLDDSLTELERSKLAVWDYPVSDKYTKIWQSMQEAELPLTDEEAYARVRASPSSSEGFAFLGDATDIRYQTLINCDLQMVGEEFSRKPYALAVQQGSPLKDQLNDAILKLLNQRKLENLKEKWWNQNPLKKSCDDTEGEGGGISIHNIGGVFIVVFVGIGLAIITLAVEYWYYKSKRPGSQVGSITKVNPKFDDKMEYIRRDDKGIAAVANPW